MASPKLDDVCARVGYPKTIRVDNGSEFISRDMDLWAYQNDVTLDFSRPIARQTVLAPLRGRQTNGQRIHRSVQQQVT